MKFFCLFQHDSHVPVTQHHRGKRPESRPGLESGRTLFRLITSKLVFFNTRRTVFIVDEAQELGAFILALAGDQFMCLPSSHSVPHTRVSK